MDKVYSYKTTTGSVEFWKNHNNDIVNKVDTKIDNWLEKVQALLTQHYIKQQQKLWAK